MPKDNDLLKTMGENIRKLRLSHNLTVNELAYMLDISPVFLRQIESGRKGFSLKNAVNLLNQFNLKFEDLCAENNVTTNAPTYGENNLAERLHPLLSELSNDEQETLVLLLKTYVFNKSDLRII